MLHDLATAVRALRRHPGSSLAAILTLALGLGLSATIFTVVHCVILRPFPFAGQDRLVTIWSSKPSADLPRIEVLWDDLERFKTEAGVFSEVAAMSAANNGVLVKRGDEMLHLQANFVSEPFYRALGVKPFMGRLPRAEEYKPGVKPVGVMSHAAWATDFGSDPAVLERPIMIDGEALQVVGVLPPHLNLPADAELIFPLEAAIPDTAARNARILSGIAKLKRGVSVTEARSALDAIALRLQTSEKETHEGFGVVVTPLVDEILGTTRDALRILLAMGVIVLVIAWANVAGLMLTRAIGRRREFALRSAMGARGRDLLRQLFAEALVVSVAASVAGFAIASLALRSLMKLAPSSLPRLGEIGIQLATFVFLSVASLAVAVGCAAVAAFRAGSGGATPLVSDAGTRATAGRQQRRLLAATAVFQVGLALALVLLSSLFVRAFLDLDRLDVGFARESVVTMHLPLGYTFGDAAETRRNFFRELVARVDALPDVEASGLVLMRPLEMEQGWDFDYTVEGQDPSQEKANPSGNLLSVTPGYFDAMKIRLVAGRLPGEADNSTSTKVVAVSESFARRHGGARAIVGRRIKAGDLTSERPWLQVVGVVGDVRYRAMDVQKPDVYVPYTQTNWSPNYLAIRTKGNPSTVLGPVRAIVHELNPGTAVADVKTTTELVGAKLAQPRLNATIVALFAFASVALAIVGLYSVVAYDSRSRTAEMGIRAAVGASRRDLLAFVLRGATSIAVPGIVAGLAAALVLRSLFAAMLPGGVPLGAGVVAFASLAMLIVSIAASIGPAWRAAGVDPVRALRHD